MLVAVGGGLGAVARFGVTTVAIRLAGEGLPIGTFIANVLGCLAIGFVLHVALERGQIGPNTQLLIVTGFLGSFTTFSTFGHETMALLREGRMLHAGGNVVASVAVGLLAVGLGWWGGSFVPSVRAGEANQTETVRATDQVLAEDHPSGALVEGREMFQARSIESEGQLYFYRRAVPAGPGPHPAIVFLHGKGESGTDNSAQLRQGAPLAVAESPDEWPFVVICPQKPDGESEWEDHAPAVFGMLDAAIAEGLVDPTRVALTGLSQGGHGTWVLNAMAPDRFRAIMPVCGYSNPPRDRSNPDLSKRGWVFEPESELVLDIVAAAREKPVWVSHGADDEVVPPSESEGLVEMLRESGTEVRFDLYPGVGHGSWIPAYAEPELAAWFVEHTLPR